MEDLDFTSGTSAVKKTYNPNDWRLPDGAKLPQINALAQRLLAEFPDSGLSLELARLIVILLNGGSERLPAFASLDEMQRASVRHVVGVIKGEA